MNALKAARGIILGVVLSIGLAGCATTNLVEGRDFDASVTAQIVKGKTTADNVIAMLGQPYSKLPEPDSTVRWTYSYVTATSHAQAGLFGNLNATVAGHKKNLYIILDKNDVVVNFVLDEGPIQRTINSNSY